MTRDIPEHYEAERAYRIEPNTAARRRVSRVREAITERALELARNAAAPEEIRKAIDDRLFDAIAEDGRLGEYAELSSALDDLETERRRATGRESRSERGTIEEDLGDARRATDQLPEARGAEIAVSALATLGADEWTDFSPEDVPDYTINPEEVGVLRLTLADATEGER